MHVLSRIQRHLALTQRVTDGAMFLLGAQSQDARQLDAEFLRDQYARVGFQVAVLELVDLRKLLSRG